MGRLRRARRRGFLRTRGDRPRDRVWRAALCVVPPHARRSTLVPQHAHDSRRGSSARAEIDPERGCTSTPATWFLRTRGDRPVAGPGAGRPSRVPPHARRSTPVQSLEFCHGHGSSARAEIDPHALLRLPECRGFLRTRGDRPCPALSAHPPGEVPPHARRSTRHGRNARGDHPGSSARAEIDPRDAAAAAVGLGFLRTRGDRPNEHLRGHQDARVPPHARRSTPQRFLSSRRFAGSSARAEIDPRSKPWARDASRFLRTRGDRPVIDAS